MATYIQRVQTVVSFSQLEDEAVCNQRPPTFGPTSPVSDCPGHTLPLYCFASCVPSKLKYRRVASKEAISIMPDVDFESHTSTSSSASDVSSGSSSEDDTTPSLSGNSFSASAGIPGRDKTGGANLLDAVLTALWDDRAERGLLRYDLSSCTTKAVPGGGMGFIAQLNEGRATKKRPTEFRVDQVCQPFDESKFNFKKAYAREVLFQFEQRGRNGRGRGPPAASCLVEAAQCGPSPNLVIINVSPIEYGHVLLVPRVMDNLPQLVDPSTMALALHFTKEADNASFRLGFNSLGAYATINHLHFQGYYLDATFPCELADTVPVQGITTRQGRINISRLAAAYPVNGFVAELDSSVRMADGIAELAELAGGACLRMQRANVPHNLLITDSGRKVFIWPQCFAERQAKGLIPEAMLRSGVNPAAFEISGHLLLKHQQDYDAVCETEVCALLAQASLPEQRFLQVAQLCFGGAAEKGGV